MDNLNVNNQQDSDTRDTKHSSISSSESSLFYFTPKNPTPPANFHQRSQSQNSYSVPTNYQPIRHNNPFINYKEAPSSHKHSNSNSSQQYHGVYLKSPNHTPTHSVSSINNPNWTSLIPPLPNEEKSADELKVLQRHSIAISPNTETNKFELEKNFAQNFDDLDINSRPQSQQVMYEDLDSANNSSSTIIHVTSPQKPTKLPTTSPKINRILPSTSSPKYKSSNKANANNHNPDQFNQNSNSNFQYNSNKNSNIHNPNQANQNILYSPQRLSIQPKTKPPSFPPPTQRPSIPPPQARNLIQQPTLDHNNIINTGSTNPTNTIQITTRKRSLRKKSRKICFKCNLEITGQFVRALNNPYHVECFTCHDCGKQCSEKFFPFEIDHSTLVPLCEFDYFKKLDLICYNCNNALRGPYITALGNKYHLEHFKCAVCQKVFESDESYYEHDLNIYCHYHYSKLFASKCEGCNSSIVKQFVELFKGGKNQQWHPECYMVHKFWNVCISADCVGLNLPFDSNHANVETPIQDIEAKHLYSIEQKIETTVMDCWLTLSGFEETTAACISDMLLNAFISNQSDGLFATGKLILNVEILFNAMDAVINMINSPLVQKRLESKHPTHNDFDDSTVSSDDFYFQPIKKEPRNISGKIMSYLAILRKSAQINNSGSLSGELLSVITGCAHYLKLLIRLGLNNALKLNQLMGTTDATTEFLNLTRNYENYITDEEKDNGGGSQPPNQRLLTNIVTKLSIPPNSTDACVHCNKSIEKACVKFDDNRRWHFKCFKCESCGSSINQDDLDSAKYDSVGNYINCKNCINEDSRSGFELVSDLMQLVYLLQIALSRSRVAMKVNIGEITVSDQENNPKQLSLRSKGSQHSINSVDGYSKTIDDVTNLRTRRQCQKLSNSIKQNARKSVILEAPEADKAKQDTTMDSEETFKSAVDRKVSTGSHMSYNPLTPEDDQFNIKKNLKIQDIPTQQSNFANLDRTTDLLKNEKSLTLDDIPRIVAAEQAREQRPNAFKHHNSLYQRQKPIKPVRFKSSPHNPRVTPTSNLDNILATQVQEVEEPQVNKNQKYYSELTKNEHFIMRHIAVEAIIQLSGNKYNKDELLASISTKKAPTFWDKFKFGGAGKNEKNNGVFGIDLIELTNKFGTDSELGVGPSSLRIPIFIDDVINALKRKDMSVEGIFRLNGNIKKLRELTEEINKNPTKSHDFSNQNAVQLAALMKKWLRELPNPLLTYSLYDLWINSQHQNDMVMKKRIIQLCYCMLPRSHRNLVEVLLYFFSWVASFAEIDEETGSKMDIHNLATVIAPNILFPKPDNNAQSKDSSTSTIQQSGEGFFYAIEVLNQMIEQHEELSIIPDDVLQFYEICNFDSQDALTTKEIMIRIDKVIKEEGKYFQEYDVRPLDDSMTNQEVRSNTVSRSQSKFEKESHGETGNV